MSLGWELLLLFQQTPRKEEEEKLDLLGKSLPHEAWDRRYDVKWNLLMAWSSTYLWAFNSDSFVTEPRASPAEGTVPRLYTPLESTQREGAPLFLRLLPGSSKAPGLETSPPTRKPQSRVKVSRALADAHPWPVRGAVLNSRTLPALDSKSGRRCMPLATCRG